MTEEKPDQPKQQPFLACTESASDAPVCCGARWVIGIVLVVVVLGISTMVYLLNNVTGLGVSPEQATRTTMKLVAMSAEEYASKHAGEYPWDIDPAFQSYFPGGGNDNKTVPSAPVNRFSGKSEWPIVRDAKNVDEVYNRTVLLYPGQIEYNTITNSTEKVIGYAIRAGSADGTPLRDAKGMVLVLSNLEPELSAPR